MYMTFERFRFLNGSKTAAKDVQYKAYSDKEGQALIYMGPPTAVPLDTFIAQQLPVPVPGVRSLRVNAFVTVAGKDVGIKDWLLTSQFDYDDALREVEVVLDTTDVAGTFVARARLFFEDQTYEVMTGFTV